MAGGSRLEPLAERLHFGGQLFDELLLRFPALVLFLEFVQQHGAHRIVADGIHFAFGVTNDEVRRNLRDLFGDQAVLGRAGGLVVLLVAKPDRPEGENGLALVAHILNRLLRELAQDSKGSGNYNTGIGEALGYEGSVIAGPDLATIQPVLKLQSSGEGVNVKWGWQGNRNYLDMIELQVYRGGGAGFQMLAMDTTPNYPDTTAPTAPTKWTYRGIYRVGDARVGQWSNEVSINVAP